MDYLKLERNESGKPFLYYNPEGNGRYKCWMPLDEELFVELQKRIASNGALADVSEIQNRAKKELLNAYYVAIFERGMSVEDILNSMEADRQFLDGEIVLDQAKNILNGR